MKTEALMFILKQEFPRFKVCRLKWLSPGISAITLGHKVLVGSSWDERSDVYRYTVLRHEAVHMRQQRRLGCGLPIIGSILFYLLYALVLPAGLSYFRYRWEREAYVESMRANYEVRGNFDLIYYADSLSGPKYLWAWPRQWIINYFKKQVLAVLTGKVI